MSNSSGVCFEYCEWSSMCFLDSAFILKALMLCLSQQPVQCAACLLCFSLDFSAQKCESEVGSRWWGSGGCWGWGRGVGGVGECLQVEFLSLALFFLRRIPPPSRCFLILLLLVFTSVCIRTSPQGCNHRNGKLSVSRKFFLYCVFRWLFYSLSRV